MPMPLKKLALLPVVMTWLTACSSQDGSEINATPPPPSLAVSCVVFSPITASSRDTTETLRQIVIHNDVWDLICSDQQR